MNISKLIELNFNDLNYEYLCLNKLPRLRILFPNYNLKDIRDNNINILEKIFKDKKIYGAVSFFSKNGKKINKSNLDQIHKAGLYWILNKGILNIHRVENNFFLHTYSLSLDFEDAIYLSEIVIASEHLYSKNSNIPYLPYPFVYFFDTEANFIVNVYGFEGVDICSYDKELLFKLRDVFNNRYKVLDDMI